MGNGEQRVIEVGINCVDLPPADWGGHPEIWVGIQRGKAVEQEVKLPAERVRFVADLRVEGDPEGSNPNFLGQHAQGPGNERFIYLCWGQRHGGHWVGFRRAKLLLSGITWELLKSGSVTGTVRCTDKKGGPICATVRAGDLTWSAQADRSR